MAPRECKVTVGITVLDGGAHLKRALDSALDQTWSDISVLVAGATEAQAQAAGVPEELLHDSRVRFAETAGNEGTMLDAFRACVDAADGDYLVFLDSRDVLAPEACEGCLQGSQESAYDIVHFALIPEYAGEVAPETRKADARYLAPEAGDAYGYDIVHRIYRDRLGPWSLFGKMFARETLRESFAKISRETIPSAADTYAFFVIAHTANSYIALPEVQGCRYRMDRETTSMAEGSSVESRLSAVCSTRKAIDALSSFISDEAAWRMYEEDFTLLRRQFTDDAVGFLVTQVPAEEWGNGFDELMEYWEPAEALEAFMRRGKDEARSYLQTMAQSRSAQRVDEGRTGIGIVLDETDPQVRQLLSAATTLQAALPTTLFIAAGSTRFGMDGLQDLTVAAPQLYHHRLRHLIGLIHENDIGVLCVPDKDAYPYCWDCLAASLEGCHVLESPQLAQHRIPDEIRRSPQIAAQSTARALA